MVVQGLRRMQFLMSLKPQSVYFAEINGRRTVVMIVELENSSMIPALSEPWFLTFNADVEFHVVMNSEDPAQSGFDKMGEKWG